MKVAIEGCAHGELDKIYETIQYLEEQNRIKVELLIICGDFQAVRNMSDLDCMAVPRKYQKLNTFYKYYSGEKKAPILTVFVGGNHEASNYLSELPYGGWVCENIYYMGYASVIQVGGLRIAGLSGIYKGQDYLKGHFETLPYDQSSKRSVYHTRNIDVFRLKQVTKPLDIIVSHDWPRGIQEYGNKKGLLRYKPFFKDDMESGKLGSRPSEELLFKLCPRYWFAAHLHCEFAALVPHPENSTDKTSNKLTKFLALDKCLPYKRFLKIIDIDSTITTDQLATEMKYDVEWLSILRSTNHLLSVKCIQNYMPGKGCTERWDFSVTKEELEKTTELFNNDFSIPRNFVHTAPPQNNAGHNSDIKEPQTYLNPQTTLFCTKLGIDDPMQILLSKKSDNSEKKTAKRFSFIEDMNVTNVSERSFDPDQSSTTTEILDESDSDVSDLFFIDRKGNQDESLSLPHLYTSSPVSTPKIIFEFPSFKEQDSTEQDSTTESNTDGSPKPSPFKIRRRNQSLYAPPDDKES